MCRYLWETHTSGWRAFLEALGIIRENLGPTVIYWALRGLRQKRAMEEGEGQVGAVLSLVVGFLETVAGLWILSVIFHA